MKVNKLLNHFCGTEVLIFDKQGYREVIKRKEAIEEYGNHKVHSYSIFCTICPILSIRIK